MHIILTGATGLVGGAVLDAMLAMPEITRISILTRRPVPMLEDRIRTRDPVASNTDRVRVVLHKDFGQYDDALLQGPLRGAAGVVWALGISQLAVNKEEYINITKTFSLAAADAFQRIPADDPSDPSPPPPDAPFRFVWVSGEGATTSPSFATSRFGRVKGEVELALAEITNSEKAPAPGSRPFEAVSVRPGAVDPAGHEALLLKTSALMRLTRNTLMPPMRLLYPSAISPTVPLGRFLAEMAMGRFAAPLAAATTAGGAAAAAATTKTLPGLQTIGSKFHILSNVAFRWLAGLDGSIQQ